MMKKFVLVLFIQLLAIGIYAQTSLSGKVKDKESGEDLITASVSVEKNGVFITGTVTDIDGNFSVNLDPGTYTVIVKMLGYGDQQINNVIVKLVKPILLRFFYLLIRRLWVLLKLSSRKYR